MQALKGLVIGLGLLIVLGVIGLGYGFYLKYHDKDTKLFKGSSETAATAAPAAAAVSPPIAGTPPAAGFGEARLDLPDGCAVTEMRPDGNRLYLRTGPTGVCERIIIVDVTSGDVLGTILVKP